MAEHTRTAPDLLDAGDVLMVTTPDQSGWLTSRPLTVAEVEQGTVSFLVDPGAEWVAHLPEDTQVNLALANSAANTWASISGLTRITQSPREIERLWSPPAKAYFDGPEDAAVLTVTVTSGEYWSAPGGGPVGRLVSIIGTALGHDVGDEQGPITR